MAVVGNGGVGVKSTSMVTHEMLRAALDHREIQAHFQRIVELPSLKTVKVEALARWTDPTVGSVSPAVFIPLAEKHGYVVELDLQILEQACSALTMWHSEGWVDLTVGVNMSAVSLSNAGIADQVVETIKRSGLDVSSVWVEATESVFVGLEAATAINELVAAGVRVALDDFGTGYSSFTNLHRLPVGALKIDRSFVTASVDEVSAAAVIRSIVGLGNELGLAVIAEGVETREEESALRHLGVSLLQGFRYSLPGPPDQVMASLPVVLPPTPAAVPAALPATEAARLEALASYRVMDTAAEEAFDSLTRIAADICGTPIALVSLIDQDRQWFKSRIGLDVTETPRDMSFCSHAILQDSPLVVENALIDERFARNPLVLADPSIRFYAGAPLRNSAGHALGTLCVIDRRPRTLDPGQIRLLTTLADQVVAHLELRAYTVRLTEAVESQRLAEELLRHQATHDPLTGLANRTLFFEALNRELACGSIGVIYVDLNGFKAINDRYGHDTGDHLLIEVSQSIRASVRSDDVVARLGGDEFAVITSVGASHIDRLERRIHAAVHQPRTVHGNVIISDAAVGSAISTIDDDGESLLARADQEMYLHKRRTRP